MKDVGLVVLSWNNADILPTCFDSIASQTYGNIRTILVDNNSSDETVEMTKEKYPWVEIVQSIRNGGFTQGNNLGIDHLLKDKNIRYIGLINSDATIDKEWVQNIVKFARYKPRGAFFQGITLDYYDNEIIDSTHIYVAKNGQATQGRWRTISLGNNGPERVFGVNAAACIISREFIDTQPFMPFFDESFFMYLEDVDVAVRALVMGWDSYYVDHAVAYHMGSATSGKNPGFSLKMTYRNNLAMLYKNFSTVFLLRRLHKIVMSDFRTIRLLFSNRQLLGVVKLLQGRIIGILRVPLYGSAHKTMQKANTIDVSYLEKLMRDGT